MKLKKISGVIALTLVLSSLSSSVYASVFDVNYNSRAIIQDSVIIDKTESSEGGSSLLPDEVLGSISSSQGGSIGTWGNSTSSSATTQSSAVQSQTGSIKISLPDTSTNSDKSNVKFSISKVADIVNGEYVLLEQYKSSGVDLNNLNSANDLEMAANQLQKAEITDFTLVTDNFGVCSADGLSVGVYLIYASDVAKYDNITPLLVSIPVWNDADKVTSYDVEIIPKHTPIPPTPTKSTTPPSVPSKSSAPQTGYSGGNIYGVLSVLSLSTGAGMLFLNKKKDY